jgi:hypothetical protein
MNAHVRDARLRVITEYNETKDTASMANHTDYTVTSFVTYKALQAFDVVPMQIYRPRGVHFPIKSVKQSTSKYSTSLLIAYARSIPCFPLLFIAGIRGYNPGKIV